MDNQVFLGFKQGFMFLFKREGDALVNVVKILSIVKTQVIQDKIVKSSQDQKVIFLEDVLPMILFFKTDNFEITDKDCEVLEENHPFSKYYHTFIDSVLKAKQAEQTKTALNK